MENIMDDGREGITVIMLTVMGVNKEDIMVLIRRSCRDTQIPGHKRDKRNRRYMQDIKDMGEMSERYKM